MQKCSLLKAIIWFFSVEKKKVRTLQNIVEVKGKIKSEIVVLKDKLKLARETIEKFKNELAKVQKVPVP